jgi:hypothetical protein
MRVEFPESTNRLLLGPGTLPLNPISMYASKLEFNDTVDRGITIVSGAARPAPAGAKRALTSAFNLCATAARCGAEDMTGGCNRGGENCMATRAHQTDVGVVFLLVDSRVARIGQSRARAPVESNIREAERILFVEID